MTNEEWAKKILEHLGVRAPYGLCAPCMRAPCPALLAMVGDIFMAGASSLGRTLQLGEFQRGVDTMREKALALCANEAEVAGLARTLPPDGGIWSEGYADGATSCRDAIREAKVTP